MHPLTELIRNDMKPALGVTEPGAIAYAVSTAKSHTSGEVRKIRLELNSGMYKNAYTCGIPHSNHYGNLYAAALGAVAGRPELGLESLRDVTEEDNCEAEKLVDADKVEAVMSDVSSRIHIVAEVTTETERARVTIWDSHTNITSIEVNGAQIFTSGYQEMQESLDKRNKSGCPQMKEEASCRAIGADEASEFASALSEGSTDSVTEGMRNGEGICSNFVDAAVNAESAPHHTEEIPLIHRYTLEEILEYVQTVPSEDIEFVEDAFNVNYALFEEGMRSDRTTYLHYLLAKNSGQVISTDELATASLLCNGAIEARVLGLDKPAMSITGSGAHGIIAVMPLYGVARIRGYSWEKLHRATALSYLICMYIKEYSGKLSAFCGCAIAAGSGMACGLVYMNGGGTEEMSLCLKNMASGITGMICDGGNHGCTMKGIAACDYAFRCADLAMNGISIESVHGINGRTPEETMRNMGRIASPGMVRTEETIVEIMSEK